MNFQQQLLAVAALLVASVAGHGHALATQSASARVPAPRWVSSATTSLHPRPVPAMPSRIGAF